MGKPEVGDKEKKRDHPSSSLLELARRQELLKSKKKKNEGERV